MKYRKVSLSVVTPLASLVCIFSFDLCPLPLHLTDAVELPPPRGGKPLGLSVKGAFFFVIAGHWELKVKRINIHPRSTTSVPVVRPVRPYSSSCVIPSDGPDNSHKKKNMCSLILSFVVFLYLVLIPMSGSWSVSVSKVVWRMELEPCGSRWSPPRSLSVL